MAEKATHDCAPVEKGACPLPEPPEEALGNWVWLFVSHAVEGSTSSQFDKLKLPSDEILGIEMNFSSNCAIDETLVLHSLVINGRELPTRGNIFTYRCDEEVYHLNAMLADILDLTDAPATVSATVNLCRYEAGGENDVVGNLSFSVFTT